MQHVTAHPDGILAVDAGYDRPGMAAIHLVIHRGGAAVVGTGRNGSAPRAPVASDSAPRSR